MSNKQKLIEHLYQYTSKELSFGCMVQFKNSDNEKVFTVLGEPYSVEYAKGCLFVPLAERDPEKSGVEIRTLEIVGHPPQWHHLLLALGKKYEAQQSSNGQLFVCTKGERRGEDEDEAEVITVIRIDLTTNLQDIPEDTAGKLCQLLNIK